VIVFGVLLVLFVLPGYAWVSWLHREDGLDLPTRLVVGWSWSFAVFSLVAGPFLWLHGKVSAFLTVAGPVWITFAVVAGLLFDRSVGGKKGVAAPLPAKEPSRPVKAQIARVAGNRTTVAIIGLYAALVGSVVYLWATGDPVSHQWITLLFPAILAVATVLALALARISAPVIRYGLEDDAAAPRLWSILAGLLILVQVVGVVTYGRPDWDDCFYLGAALDYQQGEILNDQEPTHREGFPIQAVYLLMSWELWGAILGRIAGIGPLVLFHSLLPPILVLACYAAYRALLLELLPRRWVPLALIGLCGFHLWGISNLGNASNHFLIRIWQGKAVLLHWGLPLTTLAVIRFARQPGWRWWLTLFAGLVIDLGLSSSAIYLSVCLLSCLVPLLLPTAPAGRRIAFVAGSILALAPPVGVGLLVRDAIRGDAAYQPEATRGAVQTWFFEWDRYAGNGSAEVVWLVTLPLLTILLPTWRSRALLVGLPAILLVTYGNPFLQAIVSARLTGAVTYYRLFWLYPVGLGLAVLLALAARLVGKLLAPALGFGEGWLPLAACAAGLSISAALPGVWVWGERNSRDPFMTPRAAENLEQMPAELKIIARKLADEPDITERRIACGEEVASFLTPFDRGFRFSTTRAGYTMYSVGRSRGPAEAAQRVYLTDALALGRRLPPLTEVSWQLFVRTASSDPDAPRPEPWPSYATVPILLDRFAVGYAVASPVFGQNDRETRLLANERDNTLSKNGFRTIYRGGSYSLWKREKDRVGIARPADSSQATDKKR
jgi:hypothetical protein